jgi:hypothetical protein
VAPRGHAVSVDGPGVCERGVNPTADSEPGGAAPNGGDERRRLLVVATEAVEPEGLRRELRKHSGGDTAEVHLVCPAITGSPLRHAFGDVDAAVDAARERLSEVLEGLHSQGLEATGTVGETDPLLAIQDALQVFPADEVLVVTRDDEHARWLEGDLYERARHTIAQPLTHLALDDDGAGVADVEHSSGGEEPEDAEVGPPTRNMPRLTPRDLGGSVVAVVGTLILIVLAATCEGGAVGGSDADLGSSDNACVARYIIAGIAALINVAHVVGLVLFQSVSYRGPVERYFAYVSLYGTPLAIVVSLILG